MSGSSTAESLIDRSVRLPVWLLHWRASVPGEDLQPLLAEHLRYMIDLERQGLLLASGPVAEADGTTRGAGLTALRVADESRARALADAEPFARHGLRTYTLQRWTLVEGNLALTVRLSDSSVQFAPAGSA